MFKFILAFIIGFAGVFTNCNIKNQDLSEYTGYVEHLFIHSLIAYPEILQQKNNATQKLYERDCLTYTQFEDILQRLYKNGYCLININKTFAQDKNGNAMRTSFNFPKNKKPFVLGVDDVVYDPRKSGNGMVDRIIIDDKGKIATETNIDGKICISYSREFVSILENFIALHPDFSFENARATINLTGFCGILGYRTSHSNKRIREKEIEKVKPVVSKLKQLGYNFACHSYGHYHTKKVSIEYIKRDLADWSTYVEPLIGKTNIFVYPYGEWELLCNNKISAKQHLLFNYGFRLFCGVGIYPFFSYLPQNSSIKQKFLFWDRKPLDGYTIKNRQKELSCLLRWNINFHLCHLRKTSQAYYYKFYLTLLNCFIYNLLFFKNLFYFLYCII